MLGSRWASLLARVGGVVTLVALVLPGPVLAAAAAPVVLRPAMADLTISGEITPPVYLSADTDFLSNVELEFDLAGMAGIATAWFDPSCTTAATVVTCRFSGAVMQDGLFWWTTMLRIAPVEGASPGSHGTIVISASADNATAGSHTVDVTIEAPGNWLGMVYPGESRVVHTTARAGDLVELPLRVGTGARPINGAAVVLDLSPLLGRTDDFSNCRYLSAGPLVCTFDTVLQPNTVYQLPTPIKLRADPAFHEVFGRYTGIRMTVLTGTQYAHLWNLRQLLGQTTGQPGHGSQLTLQSVGLAGTTGTISSSVNNSSTINSSTINSSVNKGSVNATSTAGPVGARWSSAAAEPQADSHTINNWLGLYDMGDTWLGLEVIVFARHAANFSATVATATIDPAGQVHLRVGITNNGPATANVPGGHANGALIRVPGQIIFHSTPPGCEFTPEQPPLPGLPIPPAGNYFWCPTGPLLRAGDTAWFDFAGTLLWPYPGSITINEPDQVHDVRVDANPDDDHATITLTQIPAAQ